MTGMSSFIFQNDSLIWIFFRVNVIKDEVDLSVKEDIIKTTPLVEITKSAPKRRRGMTGKVSISYKHTMLTCMSLVVGPAKVDKENHKNTKTGGVKGRRRALTGE